MIAKKYLNQVHFQFENQFLLRILVHISLKSFQQINISNYVHGFQCNYGLFARVSLNMSVIAGGFSSSMQDCDKIRSSRSCKQLYAVLRNWTIDNTTRCSGLGEHHHRIYDIFSSQYPGGGGTCYVGVSRDVPFSLVYFLLENSRAGYQFWRKILKQGNILLGNPSNFFVEHVTKNQNHTTSKVEQITFPRSKLLTIWENFRI